METVEMVLQTIVLEMPYNDCLNVFTVWVHT